MSSNPSLNPADNGTLAGLLQNAFTKMQQAQDGMLPARVIKYDRDANRVQVQLLITLVTTDGVQVPRPQVVSLPVLNIGGGGFLLSFPIKTGDLGWVLAADRDLSLFLQNYNQAPPNTARVKNFSDGLFIPDAMTGVTIDGDDSENIVLQNLNGTVKITISETAVTLKNKNTEVTVSENDVTVDSNNTVTINATEINIDLGSPTNMLNLNGSILATGTIVP